MLYPMWKLSDFPKQTNKDSHKNITHKSQVTIHKPDKWKYFKNNPRKMGVPTHYKQKQINNNVLTFKYSEKFVSRALPYFMIIFNTEESYFERFFLLSKYIINIKNYYKLCGIILFSRRNKPVPLLYLFPSSNVIYICVSTDCYLFISKS
jgi:hypothetical protein